MAGEKKVYQVQSPQLDAALEKLQAIDDKTVNPATKENVSNKVSAITNNDKTSTDLYTSVKATVDYVDGIVGNIETLLSQV